MLLTPIGILTLLAAAYGFRKPPSYLLALTIFLMIFGAAAAVLLPALGGASAPPTRVAVGMLVLRLLVDANTRSKLSYALRANLPMLVFVGYAMISALVLPQLFSGRMYVVAQRPLLIGGVIVAEPLGPSSANLTQLFYIVSSALGFWAAYVIASTEDVARRISVVMIWLGTFHVLFGIIDQVAFYAHLGDVLAPLRNATYAEVAPQLFSSGVKRISGSFPEPSSYATFGFPVAVFLVEWWLRRPRAPWAGITAAAVIFMILLSTASTGYVCVGAYGLCLVLRALRGPVRDHRVKKALLLIAFGLSALLAGLVVVVLQPDQAQMWADLVNDLTFGKTGSSSATERMTWARQGWDAFQLSGGMGVGGGAFRSSSLLMALLGSVGAPGCAALAFLAAQIAWPRRLTSLGASEEPALIAAAQWTALLSLLPLAVSGATPDPGLFFTIFGGLAAAAPLQRLLGRASIAAEFAVGS